MSRAARLTPEERAAVSAFRDAGFSIRRIASNVRRSRSAVRDYLRDPQGYGKKKSPGRPRKVSDRNERKICRVASNSTSSLRQIHAVVRLPVSRSTIWRVLDRSNHVKRSAMIKKPCLTKAHKLARLHFAERNSDTDWYKVVWSDEKKFNLDGCDGQKTYWHDIRKKPQLFSRRNFGGGSLMVWGDFCADMKLELAFTSTRMDSEEYQQVLAGRLLPFLNKHRTEEYLFQQDNARIHVSRSTKAFLEGHGVQVLEWPASSPDLNPIENLRGILSRRVYANYQQYATIEELKGAVLREWSNIDCQILRNLCSSMCNRLDEVKKKRGGAINY